MFYRGGASVQLSCRFRFYQVLSFRFFWLQLAFLIVRVVKGYFAFLPRQRIRTRLWEFFLHVCTRRVPTVTVAANRRAMFTQVTIGRRHFVPNNQCLLRGVSNRYQYVHRIIQDRNGILGQVLVRRHHDRLRRIHHLTSNASIVHAVITLIRRHATGLRATGNVTSGQVRANIVDLRVVGVLIRCRIFEDRCYLATRVIKVRTFPTT